MLVCCLKINAANACGYYPYGEEVRFSLLNPSYFPYNAYASFHYNADGFGFMEQTSSLKDENIADWEAYFQQRVDETAIETVLYKYNYSDIQNISDNKWLQYLRQHNRKDVLDYLNLAKKCEDLNGLDIEYDPWERGAEIRKVKRSDLLNELEQACKNEPDSYLQRRYAFLIIRLAYYNGSPDIIKTYFKTYYTGEKDFLYYWSLFFYCFTDEAKSVDYANVLVSSRDKRYASYYYFRKNFKLNEALQHARNNTEKANAYAFATVQKLDKSLHNIRAIYNLQPDAEILGMLLLREVNKLEDWILTPYYRNFTPSTEYENAFEPTNTMVLRKRSERDRLYAKEVLNFVRSVNLKKVKDPEVWQVLSIYLQFMTREAGTTKSIDNFLSISPNTKHQIFLEQIKALSWVLENKDKSPLSSEFIQSTVERNFNQPPFLFALGRELEYMGNITDGLAFITFAARPKFRNENFYSSLVWQDSRSVKSGNLQYFFNYFDYLDFVYDADDLKKIIDNLDTTFQQKFEKKVYSLLQKDKSYLLDLLGMKYIRENKLETALEIYKSMDGQYWLNNYNAWERDVYDDGYYAFDQNPFYDFKHTSNNIAHKETFVVTKISVLERLIQYKSYAADPQNQDRAYYAFLVGNCYYNMSQYGNSWMMRRFQSTINYLGNEEAYFDEHEYRDNMLAQQYYDLGYKTAKSDKMKALCLRMKIFAKDGWPSEFSELYKEFPQYYEALSACSDWNTFIAR